MVWFTDVAWWQIGLLALYAGVVLIVALRHVLVSYELRKARFLTRRSAALRSADAPLVSILVPAKDEAAGIEACLDALSAQDYPNFEILVVDDRSQDETAAIVARRAARDKRIRLLQIFELPSNWTGKTHALHQCQKEARGEWLFFVDADTLLHPSCLSIALCDCLASGADIVSLMPTLVSDSFWVSVVQPLASVLLLLLYPLSRVNNDGRKDMGFANGQFILVRRDSYRAIGGHEAVRTQVVEDIHLGRNAREKGLKLRVVVAPQLATVRMYSAVKGIVSGWSRIFYSVVDTGVSRLWSLAVLLFLFSLLPYVVLSASGIAMLAGDSSIFVKSAFALAAIHELFQWTLYARLFAHSGTSLRYLPFRIVGVFVMLYVLQKSIRMCRTHEVSWRGTTYTATLRETAEETRAAA